jgi:hypothetical protein
MAKITVQNTEITVMQIADQDYICITDMIKAKDGDFFVTDWLRNRNTLEYIGIWEQIHNPDFNYGEFAIIKGKSGLNSFKVSVKELVVRTNAISLQAKTGRYGGTYAHKDIAFQFAMWISPKFQIYMENINAVLINEGVSQSDRLVKLNKIAIQQIKILEGIENRKLLK